MVRLRNAITELAVVEGVVAFSSITSPIEQTSITLAPADQPSPATNPASVVVTAGQTITSDEILSLDGGRAASALSSLTEREIQRKLSWTEGFLEFSQTPLEQVIAELTRHNDVTIEIADPSLKDLKFGGIFRTGDVEELLDALSNLGVAVEYKDNNTYRLSTSEDE